MATQPQSAVESVYERFSLAEAINKECNYVNVPVRLSAVDLRHLKRIFDGRYEPLEEATLVVRVRKT